MSLEAAIGLPEPSCVAADPETKGLAVALMHAMGEYLRMTGEGVPHEFAIKGLSAELRAHWRQPRREPWHYQCAACRDTGWAMRDCPAETCGRLREHPSHGFVGRCVCRETNRSYQRTHERAPDDAKAKAARTGARRTG